MFCLCFVCVGLVPVMSLTIHSILNKLRARTSLSLSPTDLVICLWYVYVLASALICTAYPCFSTLAGATYMLSLYIVARLVFSISHIRDVYVALGIILWAVYELGYGVMQLVEGSSNNYRYPMTGTFLNPGPYSASLAIGLVMLCQYMKETGKGVLIYKGVTSRHIIEILTMCFAVMLPSTWSRAAILSVVICGGMMYWKILKKWIWWLAGIGFVMFVVMYYVKFGSANGRFAVNFIAIQCIMDNPLTGNGIGSYFHTYAEKTAELSASGLGIDPKYIDVLEYAFNDIMLIGVEQGIVGLFFCITLLFMVFRGLFKKSRALAYGLLALMIFSLFSYPFELLPYQIIAVVIIAYSANTDKGGRTSVMVVVAVAVLLAMIPWNYSKAKQKAENDYKMMAGMTNEAFTNDYYELLPLLEDNKNFLFDFGKMLSQQGRYNDSNAMLRKGTLISNDPMFYVLMGNNYKDMKYYDMAEQAYRKAFTVMPNRLYPLYQLMLLYEKKGEKEKMVDMAKKVVNFQEKIASPATREMKEKANELMRKK